jgi:hypothetical protein
MKFFSPFFQIFEMMDAKARQDCIKEIDLLKVCEFEVNFDLDFLVMARSLNNSQTCPNSHLSLAATCLMKSVSFWSSAVINRDQ